METRNLVIIRVYIFAKSDPWNFMQRQTVRRVNYTTNIHILPIARLCFPIKRVHLHLHKRLAEEWNCPRHGMTRPGNIFSASIVSLNASSATKQCPFSRARLRTPVTCPVPRQDRN